MSEKTYGYASRLALEIKRKHYPETPPLILLDDTLGVLTQIDNMVSGMARSPDSGHDNLQP